MWRSFSRMNCGLAQRNWAVQPENGQPDMASRCSGSSLDWPTILICLFVATGWSEDWRTDAVQKSHQSVALAFDRARFACSLAKFFSLQLQNAFIGSINCRP